MQKWAPSADPRLGVQVYLGSGSTQISMQWLGSQSDAETQLNNSGLPGVPGLSVSLHFRLSRQCSPLSPHDKQVEPCVASKYFILPLFGLLVLISTPDGCLFYTTRCKMHALLSA